MRIVRLAQRQQGHPQSGGGLELALGILARVYADGSGRAAAAGEIGQRVQGRARSAVVVDECTEGARTHVVAADEPQPIQPLLVGQPDAHAFSSHEDPQLRNCRGSNI
jgi:hypothetical protein